MNAQKREEVLAFLHRYREECAARTPIGRRTELGGVSCILHRPGSQKGLRPAVILLHGGSWVGGDAVEIDSLARCLCEGADAVAINMNYVKADEKPFPHPPQEVCALLSFLRDHGQAYGVDPDRVALCGMSAGAHIVACSAVLAKRLGLAPARQILVYPFVDWTGLVCNPMTEWGIAGLPYEDVLDLLFPGLDMADPLISPLAAGTDQLKGIAPADIILCGQDELHEHGIAYAEKLRQAGVEATVKDYPEALHGFLEVNRPDFAFSNPAVSEAQAVLARDCEQYLIGILKEL